MTGMPTDIDQAKLFQTISLAVSDTVKEVMESELRAEVERLRAENMSQKHETAEEPGDLCFNEVTGIHAEADLHLIAELEQEVERLRNRLPMKAGEHIGPESICTKHTPQQIANFLCAEIIRSNDAEARLTRLLEGLESLPECAVTMNDIEGILLDAERVKALIKEVRDD